MAVPDDDRLFEEAIGHVMRLQGDPLNPALLDALQAWRHRSDRHEHVWREVVELHGMAGQVLRRGGGGMTRRHLLGGGAAVVALGAAAGLGPGLIRAARADHRTGPARISEIPLPDGSLLVLGPDSAVTLDPLPAMRGLTLLQGMAVCEVAEQAERPFHLRMGRLEARAPGPATLSLSGEGREVTLAVEAGTAVVESPGAPVRMAAGDWLRHSGRDGDLLRGTAPAGEATAWREHRLVAEDESVAVVIARIGRWIPGEVVMADPRLARARVSGVFHLDRPYEALAAVVYPQGGHVRRLGPFLTVITPL